MARITASLFTALGGVVDTRDADVIVRQLLAAGLLDELHLVYAPDPEPPTGSYDSAKQDLPKEDAP
jgi:hypothetical protein